MATIMTDLICNLNQPVAATFLHGNLFSQDNAGNTINVHVMDNGEPATIGGTVSANVIRADGNTVAVSGAIEGNRAYVILPQACYAVPGRVEIIIKLTQSTTITTIAAIVANVYRSTTDTVVDPGTIIPSIQTLIEEIEEAVDSIPVDYSGLLATIAADYSSSKTYPVVGMYAWQGGVLKRNIVPITTAETYTAAHWTNAVLGDDVSALKSALIQFNAENMLRGVINYESRTLNGITFSWNNGVCTVSGKWDTSPTVTPTSRLFNKSNQLPPGMEIGKRYFVYFKSTDANVALRITPYVNGSLSDPLVITTSSDYPNQRSFILPENTTGLLVRVEVRTPNVTIDATTTDVYLLNSYPQDWLMNDVVGTNKDRDYNSYNILNYVGSFISRTLYGVQFTWNDDNTQCTANGTADGGRAFTNIYNNASALPDGILAGEKYIVKFNTTDDNLGIVFGLYDSADHYTEQAFSTNGILEVPSGCIGMYVRLYVSNGNTVTNAVASNIGLLNAKTNEILTENMNIQNSVETGYDVLTRYGVFTDREFRGVTFEWTGRQCHISGTASGGEAFVNVFYGLLPDGMIPGNLYRVRYASTSGRIGVRSVFYDAEGTEVGRVADTKDFEIVVPQSAKTWLFRVYVLDGVTLDGTLTRLQVVKMREKKMDVPLIVSFVDDDTTNDTYVTRYHDACCHNGVKGNYAVITQHVEDGDTSASKLLAYEDDGFGTLIHCYQQYYPSDSPWNPSGGVRTEAQTNACRANLAKGMRQMNEMGLVNYKYWITPGGHMEQDLIEVSKQLGLKCLISTNNGRENNMTDYDKQFIKRVSFSDNDSTSASSMTGIKALIDAVASRGKGWLIITTHFNDGWSSQTWDDTLDENGYPVGYSRFNEMVQYAISKGLVPMSLPQAWEYYAPILEANRDECNSAN